MNKRLIATSTLASALALALGPAQAADAKPPQEKCYGIAKAGQNDCAPPAAPFVRGPGQGGQRRQRLALRRQGHVREDGRLDARAAAKK